MDILKELSTSSADPYREGCSSLILCFLSRDNPISLSSRLESELQRSSLLFKSFFARDSAKQFLNAELQHLLAALLTHPLHKVFMFLLCLNYPLKTINKTL